jgi:hypothetical protein
MEAKPKNWKLYHSVGYIKGQGITFGERLLGQGCLWEGVGSLVVDTCRETNPGKVAGGLGECGAGG